LFDAIDRVLVMGTVIGIKGAELDPATPGRVSALVGSRAGRPGDGQRPLIVVDGGIRPHTVKVLAEAGADGVVPGSFVFGHPNPVAAVRELHGLGRTTGAK
jgi:ribulose-phosphate 3-epimerase